MEQETGGPAFPATNYIIPKDLEALHVAALGKTQGMTLRDYFAAKAMQGLILIVAEDGAIGTDNVESALAEFSYRIADAMLVKRSPPNPTGQGTPHETTKGN